MKLCRVLSMASGLLLVGLVAPSKTARAQWAKDIATWEVGTDGNYNVPYNNAVGTPDKSSNPNLKSKVSGTAGPGPRSSQYKSSISIGQSGAWLQSFVWNGTGTSTDISINVTMTSALIQSGGSYFTGSSYIRAGGSYGGDGGQPFINSSVAVR